MDSLAAAKQVIAGLVLGVLSLAVARDYTRTVRAPRRPGLALQEPPPEAPPSPYARRVGAVYAAVGVIGYGLALLGLVRLLRDGG